MTVAAPPSVLSRPVLRAMLLRFMAGFAVVLLAVTVIAYFARPAAEATARGFVERFGVLGMALGTLLADGLSFPVPPQFYMLMAIASHANVAEAFAAIALGSVVAGAVGYFLSERVSHWGWIARKTAAPRQVLSASFTRYGYRAALVASLLPVPYSMVCYLAGLNRLPLRFLGLLMLCRVPKLLAFFYLVHLGWSIG